MSKLLLVTINIKKKLYGQTANTLSAIAPNIPLGILDSYLSSKDIPVKVIDSDSEGYDIDDLIKVIEDYSPTMLGVVASGSNPSASTMQMVGVLAFYKKYNALKVKPCPSFIIGGHPTVLARRSLLETKCDFVVVGEGYEAVEGLYSHYTSGKSLAEVPGIAYFDNENYIYNPMPELIDIATLPMINWEKMNPKKFRAHNWHCFGHINDRSPYAIIWTNQGCPYPCDFCSINNIFGKRRYRLRTMEEVVSEIDVLVNDYGVRNLKILDELFITKHKRMNEFCDLLEERNYDLNMWCFARTDTVTEETLKRLKGVGVNWVAYGFESFNKDILTSTNKRIKNANNGFNVLDTIKMTRDAGMNICADVIAGLWDDDEASILHTRDFMLEHLFEWVNIYPCFAYPGTPLYDKYIEEKRIEVPKTWDTYGLYSNDCIPLPTKHLSPAEVLRLRDHVFDSYYKEPAILSMLEKKFGIETRDHVEDMVKKPLARRIVDSDEKLESIPSKLYKPVYTGEEMPSWYRGELIV